MEIDGDALATQKEAGLRRGAPQASSPPPSSTRGRRGPRARLAGCSWPALGARAHVVSGSCHGPAETFRHDGSGNPRVPLAPQPWQGGSLGGFLAQSSPQRSGQGGGSPVLLLSLQLEFPQPKAAGEFRPAFFCLSSNFLRLCATRTGKARGGWH